MIMRQSEHRLRKFRGRNLADRGQLPTGGRMEHSRTSLHASRPRSWLSTGLAQKSANHPAEQDHGEYEDSSLSDLEEDAEVELYERLAKLVPDTMSKPSRHMRLGREESHDTHYPLVSPEVERPNRPPPNHDRSLSYDERNYIATSKFFENILGKKYNWKRAVDALLPMPQAPRNETNGRDEIERPSVKLLLEALGAVDEPSTQHLFRLYRNIPSPGVAKLSKRTRGNLLRRFANPQNRRWADARRYLALVEDMASAGLPMSRSLWSSAIHFAGRGNGSGKVLRKDLVRAIGLWQQMEHVAGVQADGVVFGILFDAAIKSGQYVVAADLETEMRERGLDFDRYGMVAKIFSYGLQKNVAGISATFEKFVESGEIVDTVALNCLCASYLRAGEVNTAEQIYARMLEALRSTKGLSSSIDSAVSDHAALTSEFLIYRQNTRKLGRHLKKSHALKKQLPAYHRALQASLPMTPDTRTFYIFLRHFSRYSGQLDMFMAVLRDMESTYTVPPRNLVYMLLFEGFGIHGDKRKSWSAERLRLTWHAYLRALRDSQARLEAMDEGNESKDMVWENPLSSIITDLQPAMPKEDPNGLYVPLPSANAEMASGLQREDPGGLYTSLPSDDRDTGLGPVTTEDPDKPAGFVSRDDEQALQEPAAADEPVSSDDEQTLDEPTKPHSPTAFFSSLWPDAIGTAPDPKEPEGPAIDEPGSRKNYDMVDLINEEAEDGYPEYNDLPGVDHRVENGVFIGRKMIVAILRAFGTCCGPKEVLEVWFQLQRLWHPNRRKANDVLAVKEELDRQLARNSSNVR